MTDRQSPDNEPAVTSPPSMRRFAAFGTMLLVLAGCVSTPEENAPPPPMLVYSDQQLDGSVRGDTKNPRLASLWADAESARDDGDDQEALDLLLQGLELDSRNSLFWSRAAEIQLRNDQSALAENYALRSNEFADKNRSLLLRNWLMIRHARSMRGDLLGVRSAEKKIEQFRYRKE